MSFKISKTQQLRNLLQSPQLEFMMEAHNGMSAKIVEEAGFKSIWASGLALSAQFGVRDNNEASWTQIVDMLEFMSDATNIPILLDGDTGYGNFNNMRRLVKKLEQRQIAGVCIEDKLFPKTNSFIASEKQPLADIDEFCGKIKAGKESQSDPNFCIIARVEAFIAGWDLSEALKRAQSYHEAGADGILIHSKLSRPDEILAFAKEWANRSPLIIVPTKYYSTPTEVFRKANVSLIIWANHLIRGAISTMQRVAQDIYKNETLINIEDEIAPVKEVFRLQGAEELLLAEKKYFTRKTQTQAVILGASQGKELNSLTLDKPKVMLPISGKPLLRRLVDELKKLDINEIQVVAGYKAESIKIQGIQVIINNDYETTGELASLACSQKFWRDDLVILYGDLLFRNYILRDLLEAKGEIITVVDSGIQNISKSGNPDYAFCSKSDDRSLFNPDVNLLKIDQNYQNAQGRWLGMLKVNQEGKKWLDQALIELKKQANFNQLGIPDLCNYLINQGKKIKVLYINGHWLDLNSLEDLDQAGNFTHFQ